MEGVMMMMIDRGSDNSRFDHIPEKPITDSTCPSWKLYENPFYNSHSQNQNQNQNPHQSIIHKHLQYCLRLASTSFFDTRRSVKRVMDSELEFARNQMIELKTELEYERKARKKVESLAKRLVKELDEERKGREAIQRLCQELAREISLDKEEIDRMKKEIEEERKMLRLAEILREERVQMKLAEVKILFEDKLLELEDHMRSISTESKLDNNNGDESGNISNESLTELENIEIPVVTTHRKAWPEPENPHIMRGIKGFVEFPRVVRAKGLKSRDSDAKLECQKAQLRVLLKQKGCVRSNNLIIS